MSKHVAVSPEEAADRLAIRELVEATPVAPIAAMRKARWLCSPPTAISWCT
jgi:hypothetical protein